MNRLWAAMQLSEHPDVWTALDRGLPVPRERLAADALAAIDESAIGEDVVLTDDLVLRCETHLVGGNGDHRPDAPGLGVVTLDEFVAVEEPGAEALVGDEDDALIPDGGDVMFYGDGGAGKTTLAVDLAFHLAAGDPWLGMRVARPVSVLIVENEGPRALFRRKLRRKRETWGGSPLDGRLKVLEKPWAEFTFADATWRVLIAAAIDEHEIDVVVVGPVTRSGMNDAGTLQEVRDFTKLVDAVRAQTRRRLTVVLVHHENKGGQVSGAWEGAGDTLFHVQAQGQGSVRLHVQKARWSSSHHKQTLQLKWADGEGFELDDKPELDDDTLAEQIVAAVRANPGTSWTKVEEATRGANRQRRMAVRDRLLSRGEIVNVRKGKRDEQVALAHCEERKATRLYARDDPSIRHLLPALGADQEQIAPAPATEGILHLLPAPGPTGEQGTGAADPSAAGMPSERPRSERLHLPNEDEIERLARVARENGAA